MAPSSATAPALATLLTGLRPWAHQVLHDERPRLAAELPTVAETLQAIGYRTTAYRGRRFAGATGFDQGFELVRGVGRRAFDHLRRLRPAELVWIDLEAPTAPYRRHADYLDRLPDAPADLPPRLGRNAFLPRGAAGAPRPRLRRQAWALYRLNVAAADHDLGRLLRAVEASGRAEAAAVAIVGVRGEALGAEPDATADGALARALLEVPLVLRLPGGGVAAPAAGRVATERLAGTLIEVAGGRPLPALAPSLLRPAAPEILSEVYRDGDANRFSLVAGEAQLLWTSRYAPGTFVDTPPLSDRGAPELALRRWVGPGAAVEPLADPELAARLQATLERRWRAFVERETTPAEEAAAILPLPPGRGKVPGP